MSNRWDNAKILELQQKGLKVNDPIVDQKLKKAFGIPKTKKTFSGKEKSHIEWVLIGLNIPFAKEYKFLENRKYRMDWAIVEKKICIEYEGIYSDKSGHTSMSGYSENCNKYNLATINGWKLLRYTASNYMNIVNDIETLLNLK